MAGKEILQAVKPRERWLMLRAGFAILLVAMGILATGSSTNLRVLAEGNGQSPQSTATGYPYPPPENTPGTPYPYPPVGTNTPGGPTLTSQFTLTFTATLKPNTFQTENSEINNALVTPPASETPGPSLTPYATFTATRTLRPTAVPLPKVDKGGFQLDLGMFWIGFSIPVLAACGVILYLIDRRPDLFRYR